MRPCPLALAVALCSGCGAQISDGSPDLGGITGPDAGSGGTGTGSGPAPVACTRRVVYLNFDGQALVQGPSDATLGQAPWMTTPTGTAPRYRADDADRDPTIQTIVDGVTAELARFPITVTRTRPSSSSYVMIVYGGTAGDVGSNFGAAVAQLDCGDTRPSDVAWISDNVAGQRAINDTLGAIGFGLGLTATTDVHDCMCGWDNDCRIDNSAPCTLGSPIARDPDAGQLCPGTTTQDEVAALRTAFCQ
ncbi:MAG TPA: hypothetical protein VHW23_13455 [Kofleriaceae bacterium]|jgi:hypothetical protein|nr:hypothetical protein [Kofleriaceae bacterium]